MVLFGLKVLLVKYRLIHKIRGEMKRSIYEKKKSGALRLSSTTKQEIKRSTSQST